MLTYSTKPRGGVVHALKLAERLAKNGVDVTLYSLSRSDDEDSLSGYFREVDVPYEIFPYEWDPDVLTRLGRMIRTYVEKLPRNLDVYHAQDCVGGTALHRLKEQGEISAPTFRTVHHVDDFAEPSLFRFEEEAVSKSENRFVVSEYWKKNLLAKFRLESVVAYNGIDMYEFSGLPARTNEPPNVLFVGGLEPRKGLEHLILAMEFALREVPDANLTVVAKSGFRGVDDPEWFRILAERAGLGKKISFLESVSQERLMQLYADCDVVVLPSRNEGWGLSLMEAMACKKPVVATRVGGVPELVDHEENGFLVEPGDTAALTGAIVRLLKDKSLRDRLGDAGYRKVSSFTWDKTADVVLRNYQEALRHD